MSYKSYFEEKEQIKMPDRKITGDILKRGRPLKHRLPRSFEKCNHCVGAVSIPQALPLPMPDITMNTRKGVYVSYVPAEKAG